jgi:hypothetical protein
MDRSRAGSPFFLAKRGKSTLAENHYLWKPQA